MAKKKGKLVQLTLIDVPEKKSSLESKESSAKVVALSCVLVLRVKLMHNKRVRRDIEIGSRHTLHDLHNAIFRAFNRSDPHMYTYYFPERPSTSIRVLIDSPEVGCQELSQSAFPYKQIRNATKTRLNDMKLVLGQKFYYLFDFGDEWWHEVEVVSIDESVSSLHSPVVVKKVGKSPPQYEQSSEESF